MARLIQTSFAKGVMGPNLYGRVDTAMYDVAMRDGRNFYVHQYGGASNRHGLRYREPVKDHTKQVRMIPFEFKTTDQYMLEFGDQYMRVMRNNAHVLDTSEQSVITGITQANPAVVTTSAAHGYVAGQEVFLSGVVGMVEVNQKRYTVGTVTSTTFELTDQVDGGNVDSTGFTAYTSGGTADLIFEIATPYLEAELFDIVYTQSADVMTLTHKNHPAQRLSRLANDDWTIADETFVPQIDDPNNVAITVNSTGTVTDRYIVTAIAEDDGEESLAGVNSTGDTITGATQADPVVITATAHSMLDGDEIEITGIVGMVELNGRRFTVRNPLVNSFELEDEDGTGHTAYVSGGLASETFTEITNSNAVRDNTISWNAVTGADRYAVYRRQNGVYGIVGETNTTSFTDDNIDPDTTISPPRGADPFAGGNNPGAVSYYEQRRVFGGSIANPDTNWFSQTGRERNFNTRAPVQPDDAITVGLTSRQVNEIRQYLPGQDLLVFTSGSEWLVNSGGDTGFQATTLRQKPQTDWGSSFRPPIQVDAIAVFCTAGNNQIRSLAFNLQLDKYNGADLLLLAPHFLESDTVKDWAYHRVPESRIHVVLDSGKALSCTFNPDQDVLAWTDWDTDGSFESVAVLGKNGPDNNDTLYFVVKRTINGRTVRYIETYNQQVFETVEDCFYVDSGATFDNPVAVESLSLANPVVVTSTGHGLSDGDFVDLEEFVWTPVYDKFFNNTTEDHLNGGRFKVANSTANTFELTDNDDNNIDGTGFAALVTPGVFRKAVLNISGLDHLEGEDVVILADGNVVEGLTVSGGSITLPRAGTRVHIGLRYTSDLETLDAETPQGTTQGQKKKINNAIVRFFRSRGMLIGPSRDQLVEAKWRQFEKLSEPTRLLTGDIEVDLQADWNTTGRIFIRQKDPLPMTILTIIPDFELGDEE